MKYYEDKRYDVVVAGGGPAGVPAAVAAARQGAQVLIVERFGFLGGMATAGLVNPWMPFQETVGPWKERDKDIIEGVLKEINDRLGAKGGLAAKSGREARIFDPEILKIVLQEMVEEAGVSLLCHAVVCGCEREGASLSSIKVAVKGDVVDVKAKVFIDCTGDADLSAAAGAVIEKGRGEDGKTQPCTLNFRLGGVDRDAFDAWQDKYREENPDERLGHSLILKWQKAGKLSCPRDNFLIFSTNRRDVLHFNQTRIVNVDVTDPNDMTRAQVEGTRQVWEFVELFRAEVGGLENCYIHSIAPQIGVRESRRVVGDYVLTESDVLGAAKFDDGIVRCNYVIDIHSPTGAGTVIKHLEPGTTYEIPYRCLTPKGLDNLLVAGRPISATHEAHSSLRVMPTCIGIGEAAGIAAAMAAASGCPVGEVDAAELRAKIVAAGGNLGREPDSAEPKPATATQEA